MISGGAALVLGAIVVVVCGISERNLGIVLLGLAAFPIAVITGSKLDQWERNRR